MACVERGHVGRGPYDEARPDERPAGAEVGEVTEVIEVIEVIEVATLTSMTTQTT